ncbi:MAG: class I adenylate-forming enzyme family protein, partial [Deltaproteobacteria bacterium]|nr:class I adenylate-forming enzyme family protein [Deltaproteobacteria bacterium]
MGNLDIHIGEILARNARLYPNDVALIERVPAEGTRKEITWKQFDELANRFANALMQRGIKKGGNVVHLMMNSIDWLIAYFGIIRTGAWAVPLNFRFSGSDIKYCCEVAEPQCMVFGEEFSDRVTGIKDELPTVKDYIFVGKELPSYAEPFERLLE